jgi:hypothetical protein
MTVHARVPPGDDAGIEADRVPEYRRPQQVVGQDAIRDRLSTTVVSGFRGLTTAVCNDTRGQSFVDQRHGQRHGGPVPLQRTFLRHPWRKRSIFAFTVPRVGGNSDRHRGCLGKITDALPATFSTRYRSGSAPFMARVHLARRKSCLKNPESTIAERSTSWRKRRPNQRTSCSFSAPSSSSALNYAVRFATLDPLIGSVTPDIAPAYNYLRSLEKTFQPNQ